MAALQLTYMLLPNFSFTPSGDIQLGTLLALSSTTKLPDPSEPLSDESSRIAPDEKNIKRDVEEPKDKPWCYTGKFKSGVSGGFTFDIPFITALSAGLKWDSTNAHDLKIQCRRVETSSFVPSKEYISRALKDDLVQDFATRQWRPSIFMVTGIKVAYEVKIEYGRKKAREASANLGVDLSGFGAPIKIGPNGQRINDQDNTFQTELPGPLILAYQLKRIRMKRRGSFTIQSYEHNPFLFDGGRSSPVDKTKVGNLDAFWDFECVSDETILDDEL